MANVTLVGPATAAGAVFQFPDGTTATADAYSQVTVAQDKVAQVLVLAAGFEYAVPLISAQDGITAHAGGGQASAVLLATGVSRVTTVATIADSVKLPAAVKGMVMRVVNAATNSMNVFPATGEQINAAGANAAFAVAGGKTAEFIATGAGQWHAMLSA